MKALRLVFGSIAVYLTVAVLHACGNPPPGGSSSASSSLMTGAGSIAGGLPGSGGYHAGAGGEGGFGGAGGKPGLSSATSGGHGGAGGIMDPVGDVYAEQSGSRLKARWRIGEDGSKQFITWFDSARGEECSFGLMSDGKEHCVPFGKNGNVNAGFTDPSCTTPAKFWFWSPSLQCLQAYYKEPVDVPACTPSASKYYQIGAVYSGGMYSLGTTCSPMPRNANLEYRLVGPELPPSAFVAASTVTDP